MSGWNDNLRVHYDKPPVGTFDTAQLTAERTAAQKTQDLILENAENAALEALAKATEAIEWLSIVASDKIRAAAPVAIKQLHAEIVELRRVRQ